MKYAENPRVKIANEKVPLVLRRLVPLARKWGIVGETDALRQVDQATEEELREFVEAFHHSRKEIQAFCSGPESERIPVPDEVVMFQLAFHAFEEAEPVLRLKQGQ